jgi:hypothetical protein
MERKVSKEIEDKKKHLAALEEMLAGPVHIGFVIAREHDIRTLKDAILMNDPDDRRSEIEGFKLRGELRYAEQMVKTFEDARVSLKDRIDEMVERELQERVNVKQ